MDLTKEERRVVLFLVIVALIGLGINFLTKHYSQIKVIGYVNRDINKVNLNQATKETLIEIPGIGKVLAQRIIEYRQSKKFKDICELKRVKGIGEYKYGLIKNFFIVE